jgi:hypothetical protein
MIIAAMICRFLAILFFITVGRSSFSPIAFTCHRIEQCETVRDFEDRRLNSWALPPSCVVARKLLLLAPLDRKHLDFTGQKMPVINRETAFLIYDCIKGEAVEENAEPLERLVHVLRHGSSSNRAIESRTALAGRRAMLSKRSGLDKVPLFRPTGSGRRYIWTITMIVRETDQRSKIFSHRLHPYFKRDDAEAIRAYINDRAARAKGNGEL